MYKKGNIYTICQFDEEKRMAMKGWCMKGKVRREACSKRKMEGSLYKKKDAPSVIIRAMNAAGQPVQLDHP